MNTKMMALALLTLAGTALAQNSIVSDRPGTFVELSGRPGVNSLINGARQDDTSFGFTSSVTNAVFASTNVRVCTNGFIQFGAATGATAYANATIASGTVSPLAPTTAQALMPFWDDQLFVVGGTGEIYWMEGPAASFGLPASRGNVLIIEWSNAPHYNGGNPQGDGTYQVQIYQNVVNGVAAQMLYTDLDYGDPANMDNGVSATVGFASGSTGGAASLSNVLWSYNTSGNVGAGTVLSLLVPLTPTNPTVSGSVSPSPAMPGDTVVFTATPVGGINPASTVMQVRGDLTPVGGGANVLFHDDGANGDAAAGDGVFSYQYVMPLAQVGGNYTVNLTVTDAQSRSGSGTLTGNVFNPTNLGTLVDGTATTVSVDLAPAEIKWYRFTAADCTTAAQRNLLVTTANSTNGGDSEIGVFNSGGGIVAINDDAVGLLSRLLFGYQGTAGDLGAGEYFVAVGSFNTTYTAPFGTTSTSTVSNTFQLDLLQTHSFPPVATGASTGLGNGQVLLTVNVTPGVNPDSTGIAVVGDLSGMGGSSSAAFHDDGLNGDATAGDNIFSYTAAFPTGDPDGTAYTVSYTVTDQQSNNVTGNINVVADLAGDMPATAFIPAGTGELSSISGAFGANDVDMYKISICDPASFSATTVGGTTADTQLFLFDENGMGVTFNDDSTGLQSTLTAQFVSSSGNYYIAVSRFDIDPVDAGGNELWIDTPYGVERQPDGAGAGSPIAAWNGANAATATYTISFTGTCYPTNNSVCSPADLGMAGGVVGHDRLLNNNDFIAFITLFFANDPRADMGMAGGVPGSDSLWNNNDFIAFISYFFNDAAHCNG
ncbi:MAG: GC-type dockerin domain-anchored protein [Phycisphaerales bacterium]